jgi:hypothetical protein
MWVGLGVEKKLSEAQGVAGQVLSTNEYRQDRGGFRC